jgi:hypothetical protein
MKDMEDDLREQLEKLARAVVELEHASKRALGIVRTIDYLGIPFNVSRRFVIADLTPLAFFHLVEHIEDGDPAAAIARLHDRLTPLLTCRHDWTPLRRADDERVRILVTGTDPASKRLSENGLGPYICKSCTAYALAAPLPVIGRTLASAMSDPPQRQPQR